MLTKGFAEIPELLEKQREILQLEIKTESSGAGHANLSAKAEMAKELGSLGLSNSAIGRVLHLPEETVEIILSNSR